MSCIITYNGQNFTQEDFLDYLKSQIPISNIIKPGVKELFESNPELANAVYEALGFNETDFEPKLKTNPVRIGARFPKDQIKANYADGIIAYGTHSTGKYAEAFGGIRTSFKEGEVIMISVNGNNRPNQKENVEKTKRAIDQAISQGVSAFIADNKIVANSSHNSDGEGVIREYLLSKGLIYQDFKGVGLYIVPKQSVTNLPTSNETINIYAGSNENRELSNFAIRPFTINVETPSGEKQYTFQSVEQGFHFYKALVANNTQIAKQILVTTNGGQLKKLTDRSNLKMTSEQIKEWDNTSKNIMLNLMYDSYAQNPQAAEKLLATGDAKITHEGPYKPDRWTKDFPEVVMTVRDMLKEEGFDTQLQITPQQKATAQQLYSEYLDTIISGGELAHHGTDSENLKDVGFDINKNTRFNSGLGTNFFLESDKTGQYGKERVSILYNPKNLLEFSPQGGTDKIEFSDEQVQKIMEYHDLVGKVSFKDYAEEIREKIYLNSFISSIVNKEGSNEKAAKVLVSLGIDGTKGDLLKTPVISINNPDAMHILGSKKDVEGFKDFVNNNSSNPSSKNETNTEKKIEPIKPQSKDFISNKVNSNFDKYGYVDILTSGKNNFDFKSAVIKYILKDLGLEFKSDKELNNYLIKEKNEGRTFNLMQYVTLEELPDNKTRVKLNKRNLLLDSVEDFKPKSLGGLNFTSSGRDFESKNIFKNNIEQAFNCK